MCNNTSITRSRNNTLPTFIFIQLHFLFPFRFTFSTFINLYCNINNKGIIKDKIINTYQKKYYYAI